jgi:hypothetical protein
MAYIWASAKSCLFMLLFALIGACTGFPDKHPDPAKNTVANNQADLKECARSYPETPDGVYLKQRVSCMKLKGWN